MKFLSFIIACYTLALSIAPCNDVHEGQTNVPLTIQAAQEHHQEDNDICSPFCICNCCQSSVVISGFNYSQIVPVFITKNFSLNSQHSPSLFASDHWQPPRA